MEGVNLGSGSLVCVVGKGAGDVIWDVIWDVIRSDLIRNYGIEIKLEMEMLVLWVRFRVPVLSVLSGPWELVTCYIKNPEARFLCLSGGLKGCGV